MNRVLITGAEGFVGRELVAAMSGAGFSVVALVRADHARVPASSETVCIGDIGKTDWSKVVGGADAVFHLAGRAHVTDERAQNPIETFRAVNVVPTLKLFQACQEAGVGRFVFASSIGVNGTRTLGSPFREGDPPNPTEPYALSKWEAEQGLRRLAHDGGTELVVVRPSLIYGPGVKGNFLRLLRLVHSGWPLPFGAVTATRSILSLTGFCDLLMRCVRHPDAAGRLFLAADAEPIATRDLLVEIAVQMNRRRPRLISISPRNLNIMGRLSGFGSEVSRMTGSLEVDASEARHILEWNSRSNFDYDMKRMVESFLRARAL